MCAEADADTVFVDSLKDAAIGLSEDQPGAGYNRARQGLLQPGLTPLLWDEVPRRGCRCAEKFPPEFKRDVVRVARRGDLSQAEVAADFDISVESVRRWVRQADIADGVVDGQTSAEQNELVQLRREKRRLEMENEILRRAAAYFAAGSLPK